MLMKPIFEGKITLGNVLTMVTILIPVIIWGFSTRAAVDINKTNIARHDVLLDKINETQNVALRQLAVIEQKMTDHIEQHKAAGYIKP